MENGLQVLRITLINVLHRILPQGDEILVKTKMASVRIQDVRSSAMASPVTKMLPFLSIF